jgi:large subunit ribosomal protein L9
MDVLLLKDVEKLGASGAVVHVKPGYARNYLVPAGLAVPATPEQLRSAESAKRSGARKAKRAEDAAQQLKRQLEGRSVTLKLTLGENDQPFGSVTAHDIVEALGKDGLAVEKHAIQLEQPLKALGVYEVPVKLHAAVTATLKLWVVKA